MSTTNTVVRRRRSKLSVASPERGLPVADSSLGLWNTRVIFPQPTESPSCNSTHVVTRRPFNYFHGGRNKVLNSLKPRHSSPQSLFVTEYAKPPTQRIPQFTSVYLSVLTETFNRQS